MTLPTMDISREECYRKDDRLLVVHERRGGEVFYHTQHIDDEFVPFNSFRRMDEPKFEAALVRDGAARFNAALTGASQ